MTKDYNAIRLHNGVQNAVAEALADIAISGLQNKIDAYQAGKITAPEFLEYLDYIGAKNSQHIRHNGQLNNYKKGYSK